MHWKCHEAIEEEIYGVYLLIHGLYSNASTHSLQYFCKTF